MKIHYSNDKMKLMFEVLKASCVIWILFGCQLGAARWDWDMRNIGSEDLLEEDAASGRPARQVSFENPDIPFWLRGVGAVFFLHEGGDFDISLYKRDENTLMLPTPLKAILLAPDRKPLYYFELPDDGLSMGSGVGPAIEKSVHLKDLPQGVYKLLVLVGNQRSGKAVRWGWRSNVSRYVIDPGGTQGRSGSKIPIQFGGIGQPGWIWFKPTQMDFMVRSKYITEVSSWDESQTVLNDQGQLNIEGATERRPMGVRLSAYRGSVAIEGVTYWEGERDGYYPRIGYWSPQKDSWFDMERLRWALLPHAQRAKRDSQGNHLATWTAHNPTDKAVRWKIEYETDENTEIIEGPEWIELVPEQQKIIHAVFRIVSGNHAELRCRIYDAEDSHLSDYSTVIMDSSQIMDSTEQDHPVVKLDPYVDLEREYGYKPEYPLREFHGHPDGRLFVRDIEGGNSDGFWIYDRGERYFWNLADFFNKEIPGFQQIVPRSTSIPTKTAFDAEGRLYSLFLVERKLNGDMERIYVLVYSQPGATVPAFSLLELGSWFAGSLDFEVSVDGSALLNPPVLAFHHKHEHVHGQWGSNHKVELMFPSWNEGKLVQGSVTQVTVNGIGMAQHSGGTTCLVTRDGVTYFVWGETSEPDSDDPGVPTWVAGFDRQSGAESFRHLVVYGAPKNDIHNSPALALTRENVLHVISGAHGRPFQHAYSKQPEKREEWSVPAAVLEPDLEGYPARQTYLGLVAGDNGDLHIVYRRGMRDQAFWDGEVYNALVYQRYTGETGWEAPVTLVRPPFPAYSVYYHKLSRMPGGGIVLFCGYRSAYRSYRSEYPGGSSGYPQMVIFSVDGGKSWSLLHEDQLSLL